MKQSSESLDWAWTTSGAMASVTDRRRLSHRRQRGLDPVDGLVGRHARATGIAGHRGCYRGGGNELADAGG